MKTYIINLKRSLGRRKNAVQEAERHGLDYEIIEAIDGGELSDDEIYRFADQDAITKYPHWLTKRALATSLSHLKVYQQLISDNADYAIVLEDDVSLGENFLSTAHETQKNMSDGDVVLFHYFSFEPLQLSTAIATELDNGRRLLFPMFLDGVASAAAYLISRGAAQSLAASLIPLKTAADSWNDFLALGYVSSVRVVDPISVSVIGAKSTIHVESQNPARVWLTEFADKYYVPFLSNFFRKRRLYNIEQMSKVEYTTSISPLIGRDRP